MHVELQSKVYLNVLRRKVHRYRQGGGCLSQSCLSAWGRARTSELRSHTRLKCSLKIPGFRDNVELQAHENIQTQKIHLTLKHPTFIIRRYGGQIRKQGRLLREAARPPLCMLDSAALNLLNQCANCMCKNRNTHQSSSSQ
jgi:hypothetical protein